MIRDILHRLADRFPRRVLLWPVAVQGQACAREVAAAVAGFNALPPGGPIPRPDVLIVARGGGSVEDLWGFNEEIVVRAVAASAIPVISAVGHETDTTLIDYAADRRAPTPTAAAEMAVPVRRDLAAAVAGLEDRRQRALRRALGEASLRLTAAGRLLPTPDGLLGPARQRLDRAAADLPRALRDRLGVARLRLARGAAGRFGPALLAHRLALRRARLEDRAARLAPGLARMVSARRAAARPVLARLAPRLVRPAQQRAGQSLAAAAQRLDRAAGLLGTAARERLAAAARLLETLSYRATLARGFAVVRTESHVATRAHEVPPGARLSVEFADGRIDAVADGAPRGRTASRSETKGSGGGQGSLF